MSCGTKIAGRSGLAHERDELADLLERRSEDRLADKVRRGDCLDSSDLYRAELALEDAGRSRHFDYREERCRCGTEEEERDTW